MIWRPLLLGSLLVTFTASPRKTPDDADTIREFRRAHNAAIARGDYAAIAGLFAEDITVRAGLGRALTGRQAYRDAFIADSAMTYLRTPDEVTVSSKWPIAYERGHWTGAPRNTDASLSGQYSAQWIKLRGKWFIRSEVFVALWCTGQACNWPVSAPLRSSER